MGNTKKCPYCGKEILADMTICGYCGTKLTETVTGEKEENINGTEQSEEKKENKSVGKIVIGVAILAAAIGIAFFIYSKSDPVKYNQAVEQMEKADYESAAETFLEISDYKDSQVLYMQCIYEQGKTAMEKGDYQTAKQLFESIAEYEDSKELIGRCNHLIEVSNDKEPPTISGIEKSKNIQSGTEFNMTEYIADNISITDNVTSDISDYTVVCDDDAFDQGSGKINTQTAKELEFNISAKDEAGNETVFKTTLNIDPVHVTVDNPRPVIYDGEFGTLKLVDFKRDSTFGNGGYLIILEFKNETDKDAIAYLPGNGTSINDYQVSALYEEASIQPGKTGRMTCYISGDSIPADIGSYDQIESWVCITYTNDTEGLYFINTLFDTNVAN